MKTFIAAIVLSVLSGVASAEVIETSLSIIQGLMQSGKIVQLTRDGVPVAGAHYTDQMETISADLGIDIYASVDTDYVFWFAPNNGAGSVLDRLE